MILLIESHTSFLKTLSSMRRCSSSVRPVINVIDVGHNVLNALKEMEGAEDTSKGSLANSNKPL